MAILKDLLVTGAARFKGKIYGNLAGHADTATTITGNIEKSQVNGLNTDLSLIPEHTAAIASHEQRISANAQEIVDIKAEAETHAKKAALADEASTRENADNDLNERIDDVITSLGGYVTGNASTYATKVELSAEAKTRGDADTALGNRVTALETSSATHALQTALEAEVKNRSDGDKALSDQISALQATAATHATQAALNQEIADRGTAVSGVDTKLTTHAESVANGTTLAHVKLSDTASASNGVRQGYAATPKAVQSVVTQLQDYAAYAETMYIYTGDEVLLDSSIPINADTVGGMTVDQILAEARGEGTATGTVGYSSATPSNPTSVTLTNVSSGDHLYPKTNTASITDFSSATSSFLKFAKGTTEPTKTLGTIWFYGSSAPYQIRIYNGSAWEVVNSWQ